MLIDWSVLLSLAPMMIVMGNSTNIHFRLGRHNAMTLIASDTKYLFYSQLKCIGIPVINHQERGTVCLPVSNQRAVVNMHI